MFSMYDLPPGFAPHLTSHANERIAERRLSPDAVALVRQHADLERRGRGGCLRLRLSRRVVKRLDRERAYPRRILDDARETELVVCADRQCVITAWRLPADDRFRRSGARPRIQRTWRQVED
jgi:hypothetical protein